MGGKKHHLWALARAQHGVVSRRQLETAGLSRHAVENRLARGRLHFVRRGVYAVGRPEISQEGRWVAALLACGTNAVLSHATAAAAWGIVKLRGGPIHVTTPTQGGRKHDGIVIHRRDLGPIELSKCRGIPATTPTSTLIDLAASISLSRLEAAVNQADKLDLVRADELPALLARFSRRPGVRTLRDLLDTRTFRLTDSELERRFLRLVRRACLPLPETGAHLNGFKTDFYWPQLKLVVETDGLTYHRTPIQQARDRRRDQAHAAAGLTQLRFTHAQVSRGPEHVAETLQRTIANR